MQGDAALLALPDGSELVRLSGIEGVGRHGVHDHERRDGQRFVVDVTCRLGRGSLVDDVKTTVDYGVLAERVVADITGEPMDLIESLAHRIAATCLSFHGIASVVVTVHKPDAPVPVAVGDVAVTLVRHRE